MTTVAGGSVKSQSCILLTRHSTAPLTSGCPGVRPSLLTTSLPQLPAHASSPQKKLNRNTSCCSTARPRGLATSFLLSGPSCSPFLIRGLPTQPPGMEGVTTQRKARNSKPQPGSPSLQTTREKQHLLPWGPEPLWTP